MDRVLVYEEALGQGEWSQVDQEAARHYLRELQNLRDLRRERGQPKDPAVELTISSMTSVVERGRKELAIQRSHAEAEAKAEAMAITSEDLRDVSEYLYKVNQGEWTAVLQAEANEFLTHLRIKKAMRDIEGAIIDVQLENAIMVMEEVVDQGGRRLAKVRIKLRIRKPGAIERRRAALRDEGGRILETVTLRPFWQSWFPSSSAALDPATKVRASAAAILLARKDYARAGQRLSRLPDDMHITLLLHHAAVLGQRKSASELADELGQAESRQILEHPSFSRALARIQSRIARSW